MAELIITHPDGRTRRHSLGPEATVLGRDPACEVALEDLSASRRHVRISRQGDGYQFQDLGSKNGTLLNGAPATIAHLRGGDEIMIGAVRVVYREVADPATSQAVVVSDDGPQQEATTYRGVADELHLSQRRLEVLYRLTERLTRLRDRDELLGDALDVCFEMLRFERGAIAIRRPDGRTVDWPVVRNLRGAEGELTVSRTILSSALTHGERVIVNDTGAGQIDPTVSMVQLGIRSAMCVPLLSGEQNLGVIYGDRVTTTTTYSQEDIDFLAGIARLVTIGLVNVGLLEEQRAKVRLEGEMALARKIQTGLFPASLPARPDLQVAALNDPGDHVSGDYYDFLELDGGRVAFLIADVTGEGVAASLLMANLQAAVRVTLPADPRLAVLLPQWNALICRNTDGSKFVTCLLGVVDPARRRVCMASAGHHLPYVVCAGGGCKQIAFEPGLPLGVLEQTDFPAHELELPAESCTMLCFTDGVTEALDASGGLFGSTRLGDLLGQTADIDPARLIRQVRQAVRQHAGQRPQSDDITMLALHLP